MADGKSLRTVCREDDMPALSSVFLWKTIHPEFSDRYDVAVKERAEAFIEDIQEIADNSTNDWMETNDPDNPGYKLNGEAIARTKLRVDTRKWIASKILPRYGDKVAVGGDDTMPPIRTQQTIDVSGLTLEQLEALQAAFSAGRKDDGDG